MCRRIESVDENGLCPHCSALKELSGKILNEKYAFFTILSEKEDNALELPLGYYLVAEDEKELQKRMLIGDSKYVRTYGKNKMYTGKMLQQSCGLEIIIPIVIRLKKWQRSQKESKESVY